MTYAEIIEKRNKLMHDAGTLAYDKNANAETRAKVTAMLADVDELNEQAKNAQRLEAHAEELRSVTRPPRGEVGNVNDAEREKRAFRDWMRSGTITPENSSFLRTDETRDLTTGGTIGTGGNVIIPTAFDPQLNIAQKSFGAIVGAVRNFTTSGGGPLKVALADDTSAQFSINPEVTAAVTVDPSLTGFISNTDTITTMLKVSNQLLQDAAYDVNQFIGEVFSARYFRTLAANIAQGNGSNIQKLTPNRFVTAATGGANAVTYNNLVDVYAALDPAYIETSDWVMTSSTRATLMKLVTTTGQPLLQTDLNGQPFNSIFGRSIVISQGSDQIGANKSPIMLGDLRASYTLRLAGSLTIARSVERYFELQEVAFLAAARVGGYNTSLTGSSSLVGFTNSAT